jgi:hypothetical protein
LADPSLTKNFGHHKQLDVISVQEYMYNKALKKLNINRQFEKCIKESAIDCTLNHYGNIVRLEELYTPYEGIQNTYTLRYINYQTGEEYKRVGVKSKFNNLDENVLDIRDILENTAKNTNSFDFIDSSGKIFKLNKSLLVNENIQCGKNMYAFDSKIPHQIINVTLNKELSFILMKKSIRELQEFLYLVQTRDIKSFTKNLPQKIEKFVSKDASVEKQQIIATFLRYGIGDKEIWELYPLDRLKQEYKKFNFKSLASIEI